MGSIGSMGELLVNKKWKSLSFSTMDLLSNLLALSLRDAVTMSLSRRYGSGSKWNISHLWSSKAAMDDIGCRVSGDVAEWSRAFVVCFVSGTKPVIDVAVYCSKLSSRIGTWSFMQCIFYFLASSLWTRSVVPSEGALKGKVLEFEAAFQRHNERIVEFAEEIH